MSNVRIKIFAFDSTKQTTSQIEDELNNFLERTDISVETSDIVVMPDDTTIVTVVYKLRKSAYKSPPK